MAVLEKTLMIEARIKGDPYNPLNYIALAKAYLDEGREDKARTIIATKRKIPSQDPSIHYEWGKLCEELAMARQARESYEQAIALRPQEPQYHFRLALLCHEAGAWERGLKHLQKTVALSPHHDEARRMLASLYKEMGLRGSADAVERKENKVDSHPQTIPFELRAEDATLLLDLFKGRETGYAEYDILKTGSEEYVYHNGILGFNEISEHVRGDKTLGVYLLRGDRTVRCSGIEIFVPRKKLLANLKNEGFLSILADKIRHYATEVWSKVKELGFPAYCEDSGDRGRRVWFFFQDFIPYEMAERFLNGILDKVFPPGVDLAVELLLGYKASGIGKTDHPVMLPLGVNRKTGKRCFFVDDEGTPYKDQLLFLKKVRRISNDEIQSLFKRPEKEGRKIRATSFGLLLKMQRHCPILETIVLKAKSGRNLRIEEKMILYFTVGFLPEATQILHDILEPCPEYRPNKVNKMISRLGVNPISCPKIRQLMPETTAYLPCNCSFEIPEGGYPSPVLHIDPALIPTKMHVHDERRIIDNERDTREEKQWTLNEIEARYLSLCNRIEQLTRQKEELERVLKNSES